MILVSCIEEPESPQVELAETSEIEQVKAWFEENKTNLRLPERGSNFRTESQELILPFFEKEPDWDQFHHYYFPDGREVFEVSLENSTKYFPSLLRENFPETDPSKLTFQTIMFIQSSEGFVPLIVRYYPKREEDLEKIESISYLKVPKSWSGDIDIWTYDEHNFITFEHLNGGISKVKTTVINQGENSRKINGENYLESPCEIREEVVEYSVVGGGSYCEEYCTKTVLLITATCDMGGYNSTYSEGGTTGQYAGGYYNYSGTGGGSINGGSIPPPGTVYSEEEIWNTLNQINSNSEYFIPCPELKDKLEYLVNFRPSSDIKRRLSDLSNSGLFGTELNDWRIQDIDNAKGHLVNLDYFSVTIDKLPNGFSSPEQFINYVRLKINDFVLENTENPTFFQPHPKLGPSEIQNWNSGKEGTLVSISIERDGGSVVLSEKNSNGWIFTTIKDTYNNHHPVSGNRQFGILTNRDGSYEIYTSGADRLTMTLDQIASTMSKIVYNQFDLDPNVAEKGIQFAKGDELWESFLQGVSEFAKKGDAKELKREVILNRPNWEKVI